MTNQDLDACSTLALLAEARAGNELARDVLIERHRRLLRSWEESERDSDRGVGPQGGDHAQDVLSSTAARSGVSDTPSLRAFSDVLRHSFLRFAIDQQKHPPGSSSASDTGGEPGPGGSSAPEEFVRAEAAVDRYEHAIAKLRASDRELLIARIELGLGYREIARDLGLSSAGAARRAVNDALKRLVSVMAVGEGAAP